MPQEGQDKPKQPERSYAEDAQRRAAGEAFDERMKEFSADAPRAPRPDRERRRRR